MSPSRDRMLVRMLLMFLDWRDENMSTYSQPIWPPITRSNRWSSATFVMMLQSYLRQEDNFNLFTDMEYIHVWPITVWAQTTILQQGGRKGCGISYYTTICDCIPTSYSSYSSLQALHTQPAGTSVSAGCCDDPMGLMTASMLLFSSYDNPQEGKPSPETLDGLSSSSHGI